MPILECTGRTIVYSGAIFNNILINSKKRYHYEKNIDWSVIICCQLLS